MIDAANIDIRRFSEAQTCKEVLHFATAEIPGLCLLRLTVCQILPSGAFYFLTASQKPGRFLHDG